MEPTSVRLENLVKTAKPAPYDVAVGTPVLVDATQGLGRKVVIGKVSWNTPSSPYIGVDGLMYRKYEVFSLPRPARQVFPPVSPTYNGMTLSELVSRVWQIKGGHREGAAQDRGFDYGEFSGPAHARAENFKLAVLLRESGLTDDEYNTLLRERITGRAAHMLDLDILVDDGFALGR